MRHDSACSSRCNRGPTGLDFRAAGVAQMHHHGKDCNVTISLTCEDTSMLTAGTALGGLRASARCPEQRRLQGSIAPCLAGKYASATTFRSTLKHT